MTHATKPARLPAAQRSQLARMPALIILVYSVAAYLLFAAVLGYAAGFFAGFGVPTASTRGRAPLGRAAQLGLMSGSARPAGRGLASGAGLIHPRHGGFL